MVHAGYREENGVTDPSCERVFLLGWHLPEGRSSGYIEWHEYGIGALRREHTPKLVFTVISQS